MPVSMHQARKSSMDTWNSRLRLSMPAASSDYRIVSGMYDLLLKHLHVDNDYLC